MYRWKLNVGRNIENFKVYMPKIVGKT